jgi:hypothetical protein
MVDASRANVMGAQMRRPLNQMVEVWATQFPRGAVLGL